MSTERGLMIQETVRAMGEERYLRQLAEQRDRRMAQKKRKTESSSATLDEEKEKERKEALKEYQKEWRSKNKDKVKEYNQRYRQRKEADTAATVTTSSDINNVKNTLHNYITNEEECQPLGNDTSSELLHNPPSPPGEGYGEKEENEDVTSDAPGNSSGGEIRQQGRTELPVHLL